MLEELRRKRAPGKTDIDLAADAALSRRTVSRLFNPGREDNLLRWWAGSYSTLLDALNATKEERDQCLDLVRRASLECQAHTRRFKPDDITAVLRGSGYLTTLRRLYDQERYPLVELFGTTAPICTFPAPPEEWSTVEAALGSPPVGQSFPKRLETDPRGWPREYNPAAWKRYAEEVAKGENNRRWDGPTWAFHRMRVASSGGVRIDCVPGRYYRSLATSEYLDEELLNAHKGRENQSVDLSRLPHREWLHQVVGGDNVVMDGRGRNAAVSVSATIMIALEDGGFDVMLTPRSEDVATHQYFNHVIPSGIFQPLDPPGDSPSNTFVKREFNVTRTFHREFIEELYASEEYGDVGGRPIHIPENEPEIKRLRAQPEATLYYTGVSVNLMTLRPEICLLLLITDPGWLARERTEADSLALSKGGRPMAYGWEIAQRDRDLPPGHTLGRFLTLDHTLAPLGQTALQPDILVPNAAAAIQLALNVVRALQASGVGGRVVP